MLLYCNERRITIPTDKPIIDSIRIVDKQYGLERFELRKQMLVDGLGKEIHDLKKTPNELGLPPNSTIFIINPIDNRNF